MKAVSSSRQRNGAKADIIQKYVLGYEKHGIDSVHDENLGVLGKGNRRALEYGLERCLTWYALYSIEMTKIEKERERMNFGKKCSQKKTP